MGILVYYVCDMRDIINLILKCTYEFHSTFIIFADAVSAHCTGWCGQRWTNKISPFIKTTSKIRLRAIWSVSLREAALNSMKEKKTKKSLTVSSVGDSSSGHQSSGDLFMNLSFIFDYYYQGPLHLLLPPPHPSLPQIGSLLYSIKTKTIVADSCNLTVLSCNRSILMIICLTTLW